MPPKEHGRNIPNKRSTPNCAYGSLRSLSMPGAGASFSLIRLFERRITTAIAACPSEVIATGGESTSPVAAEPLGGVRLCGNEITVLADAADSETAGKWAPHGPWASPSPSS